MKLGHGDVPVHCNEEQSPWENPPNRRLTEECLSRNKPRACGGEIVSGVECWFF